MRRVVGTDEVPHLWAHQTQSDARNSQGNLYFKDKTIFSYRDSFPIGTMVQNAAGGVGVLVTTRTYSVTTAGHVSAVRQAVSHMSNVFHVPLTERALGDRYVREHVGVWRDSYKERIAEAQESVARSRKEQVREWKYAHLVRLVAEANAFLAFFGVSGKRFEVLTDFDALKATLAQTAARERREEKERKRVLAERNAESIARWMAGERYVQLPYGLEKTYLRIEGDELVTSRGARVPVSHAVRVLRFVRAVRASGKEWRRNGHTLHIGHYTVDAVDTEGNVTAGCHKVEWAEIERIAPALQLAAGQTDAQTESETEVIA